MLTKKQCVILRNLDKKKYNLELTLEEAMITKKALTLHRIEVKEFTDKKMCALDLAIQKINNLDT